MSSILQHCTLQHENKCGIRVEPNLFRLVNILGLRSSLVGGREQLRSLLLKTDHITLGFWFKFQIDSIELDTFLKLDSIWHSFSQDGYSAGSW